MNKALLLNKGKRAIVVYPATTYDTIKLLR